MYTEPTIVNISEEQDDNSLSTESQLIGSSISSHQLHKDYQQMEMAAAETDYAYSVMTDGKEKRKKRKEKKGRKERKEGKGRMREKGDVITLNCIVRGDLPTIQRAFTVKISLNETIDYLRRMIKKTLTPCFDHIVANHLILWKVDIPLDMLNNRFAHLKSDINFDIMNILGGDMLLPTRKIGKVFTDEPIEEHVHVIVDCSAASQTGDLIEIDNPNCDFDPKFV